MASIVGEATTIVGDAFEAGDEPHLSTKEHPHKPTSSSAVKGKGRADQFVATMDYTLEERPFFIRIGKDGVIAALEKLDQQLVQVSSRYLFHRCSLKKLCLLKAGRNNVLSTKLPTDWAGKEVMPGRVGLINHGCVSRHIISLHPFLMHHQWSTKAFDSAWSIPWLPSTKLVGSLLVRNGWCFGYRHRVPRNYHRASLTKSSGSRFRSTEPYFRHQKLRFCHFCNRGHLRCVIDRRYDPFTYSGYRSAYQSYVGVDARSEDEE